MNLTWLDDFLVLASSGNFSRAAEERHMTQPAFSRRIRQLEEWLGVTLFDRSSHPATLTDAGEWFRSVAGEILARVAKVPDEARAIADASSATLRFAATHALSLTFLPAWLRTLEAQWSTGPMQLVSDVLQHCEALMLQGRVQFLLCHAHDHVPGRLAAGAFRSIRVGTDALIPVAAVDAKGKPRFVLSNGGPRAERMPLLAYSAESGIGRIVRAVRGAQLEALRCETVFTSHLATLLKAMALDGRGIAWLPASLMQDELRDGRLVEAGDAGWRVEVDICLFRGEARLTPAAESFWSAAASGA